jgi:hypothetical protein
VLGSGWVLGSETVGADGTLYGAGLKGCSFYNESIWASNIIDQTSAEPNEEQVMIQGEDSAPANVQRLSNSSPLYPHR